MDDETHMGSDHVVTPTPGSAITIPKTANEFANKDLKTKLITTTKNHQASIQNLEAKFDRLADKQYARPFRSLPSNTQPNPKGSSSKPYQPSQAQNEHVNVVFTRIGKSHDPPINLNDQPNDYKNLVNFDSEDEDEESTPQPKVKNTKPAKDTLTPKPYKPKISYPQCLRKEKMEAQYAESMLVEVGKFTFPVDFVILKIEEDSKVPLILGRPFLHTADAAIRVKQKKLNLGVRTERMTFSIDFAMKHSYSNADTCFGIDVIDKILEEDFDTLLDERSKTLHSIKGTILEEKLFA
ncbi:reverse transcriptase domain-containing protein [Tanacetum coccineum]